MKVRQLRKRHHQRFVVNMTSPGQAILLQVFALAYDYSRSLNKVKQHGPTRR